MVLRSEYQQRTKSFSILHEVPISCLLEGSSREKNYTCPSSPGYPRKRGEVTCTFAEPVDAIEIPTVIPYPSTTSDLEPTIQPTRPIVTMIPSDLEPTDEHRPNAEEKPEATMLDQDLVSPKETSENLSPFPSLNPVLPSGNKKEVKENEIKRVHVTSKRSVSSSQTFEGEKDLDLHDRVSRLSEKTTSGCGNLDMPETLVRSNFHNCHPAYY